MKNPITAVCATLCLICGCTTHPPLETAARVDLGRYAGKWYDVAHFPQFFLRGCTATTAEYTLRADGKVDVVNRCRKQTPSGQERSARAVARSVNPPRNTQLKVRFGLFEGSYWIIDLDEQYRWALVGSPDRRSLWILSRTVPMDPAAYERLVDTARERGFDVSRLEKTVH